MQPQTITASDGTVLDAGAVNLAKAIRKRESKGNYNAVGDAGSSKGAYQWQPGNFEAGARKYALNPSDFSPVNQDKVAYHQVKELKDKGYSPEQVAAAWNAGEGSLKNDKWKTNVGTTTINGQEIHYDTPGYVRDVTGEFQRLKGGYNPTPYSGGSSQFALNLSGAPTDQQSSQPQQTPPNFIPNGGEIANDLGTDLKGRGTQVANALTTATGGGTGLLSAPIQLAGAVAGGIGDVVNAGLKFIPGVQGGEKMLGQGIKAVMDTQTGKDVSKLFNDFSVAHPELAANIGAGVDIIGAIPILRGLTLVKGAIMDAKTSVFRDSMEKAAQTEIKDTLGVRPSNALASAERRGLDPVGTLVKTPAYLPEVVANPSGGFMYSSARGLENITKDLNINEAELQAKLDEAIHKNVMVSLEDARAQMLRDVRREFPLSGNYSNAVKAVDNYFNSVVESSGGRNMISLNELNGMKRDVREAVFDVSGDIRGTFSAEVKDVMGRSLMTQVENTAKKLGIDGVPEVNKAMARKIEAMKVLKALHESRVKVKGGIGKEAASTGAMVAGEAAGNAVGLPIVGALASRSILGKIANRVPRTAVGRLSRFKPDAKSRVRKGLLQIGKGVAVQGLTK